MTTLKNRANNLPDVFYMPDFNFMEWAQSGRLMRLDGDFEGAVTDKELSNIWEMSHKMYRYDRDTFKLGEGALYGLPKDLGPYTLVYNKTMLNEIIANSNVFLMDEPLSNLDAKLRVQMRSEIVKLHKALKATTIYVTHDQTEAMTMASRIVVMNKGRIQQIGTPSEIYNNPANTFVATFIGSPEMNMIKCKNINNKIVFDGNREIDMGEEFKHQYKDFYLKQIDEVNENIEKWKDVFCTREFAKKHHSSFDLSDIALENFKKEINKDKNVTDSFGNYDDEVLIKKNLMKLRLIDFVKEKIEDESLKNINELLTLKLQNINNYKVNTVTYNELIDSYKEILKEVEFEKNRILNPDIEKLIDTKIKLEKAYKDESYELVLGIRPEDIHNIEELNSSNNEKFNYSVSVAELLGHEYYVHLPLKDETEIIFKMNAKKYIESNDKVEVWFDKEKIHIFDSITSNKIL